VYNLPIKGKKKKKKKEEEAYKKKCHNHHQTATISRNNSFFVLSLSLLNEAMKICFITVPTNPKEHYHSPIKF
jgi:hypothetical protein